MTVKKERHRTSTCPVPCSRGTCSDQHAGLTPHLYESPQRMQRCACITVTQVAQEPKARQRAMRT
jgi:hypothetical protein